MIPKVGIERYLHRPLDDHRWIKRLNVPQLNHALANLRPQPDLYPKMRKHQKACFLLGVAYPQFGFWVDMGGGKTLLSLELLRYWFDCGKLKRGLILVTSDKAYLTWETQIESFKIGLDYVFLDGSSENKWQQLERFGAGLVVLHYPGMVAMLSHKLRGGWVLNDELVERFIGKFQGVVFDESTKLGNPKSLTYQIGERLCENSVFRYLLAGRPFGRDPALLWPQYRLLDGGATFGSSFNLFLAAFFSAERGEYAKEYTFKKRMMPQLTRMIQNRSITYATEEMPDLPPLRATSIVSEVRLPEEAAIYYQRLIEQVIAAKGNVSLMQNVFTRMRQLSSGYLALRDDESDERLEVTFADNPKLDRLLELLDEMPADHKAVIFYDFTYSGRVIYEQLQKLGRDSVWLWSGTKKPTDALRRFLQDPACSLAIINNRIGAYSLDGLQRVANYVFFYESPVSVIDRQQAERRVLRDGQARHVFQYDLVVRGTADHNILEFHREGRDLYEALTRDAKKYVRKVLSA